MVNKLTLTIDNHIAVAAKKYAKDNGKSLSRVVEECLKALLEQNREYSNLSPKVKKLMGVIKLPENFDYKTAIKAKLAK